MAGVQPAPAPEWTTEDNEVNEAERGAEAERIGYRSVAEPLIGFAKGRNLEGVRWLIASGVVVVGAR